MDDYLRLPPIDLSSIDSILESEKKLAQWSHQFTDVEFEKYRQQVGPIADIIRTSYPKALESMKDADPAVRMTSLFALRNYHKRNRDVAESCLPIIAADENDAVRVAAMMYVGRYFFATKEISVGKLLCKIIISKAERKSFRTIAYFELLDVFCGDDQPYEKIYSKFSFPRDVDWHFVKTVLLSG